MNRRELLTGTVAVLMMPAGLTACDGGGDDSTDETTDTGAGTCDDTADATGDSDTHGHTLTIPAADLAAGTGGTYTSTEGDSHTHEVELTAAEMTELLDNCTVTVSSNDIHPHTWVLSLPAV